LHWPRSVRVAQSILLKILRFTSPTRIVSAVSGMPVH
jgi:hypothetical protein